MLDEGALQGGQLVASRLNQAQGGSTTQARASQQEREQLPQTASPVVAQGLAGLIALFGALAVRRLRVRD